jgi:hypothetical protein
MPTLRSACAVWAARPSTALPSASWPTCPATKTIRLPVATATWV